jgi:hypothetical protein
MAKKTSNDSQNTTEKTKDLATWTPLKTGGEPGFWKINNVFYWFVIAWKSCVIYKMFLKIIYTDRKYTNIACSTQNCYSVFNI